MAIDLRSRVEAVRETNRRLNGDVLTFGEYFERVTENPSLARLSHAWLYDMIMERGTEVDEQAGILRYNFFKDELYGLEEPIDRFMSILRAAAARTELRKRVLLLMGPVGGGKSTLVTLLKRGMEAYSRTDQGAMYAIATCPLHEDPLHLVPDEVRNVVAEETNQQVNIEGKLCPVCRYYLENDGNAIPDHPWGAEFTAGDIYGVPVKRLVISEDNRVGIGTFMPSDPKSQDTSELVGSMNLSQVGVYGTESHPLAYSFDGELFSANRGLMEWVEMLKAGEEFRYVLLTLTQEQNIKAQRFALIHADEVVMAHTNENEFIRFSGDKASEAMHDRTVLIRVPYNLRLSQEVKIYQKLISQCKLRDAHIAPFTLEVAATFAVLSRLEESDLTGAKEAGLMRKLRLYDGQPVEGLSPQQLPEIRKQAKREGMDGISPRYVINQLSVAMTQDGEDFLHPAMAMRALLQGLTVRTASTPQEVERYQNLHTVARDWYKEQALDMVRSALIHAYEQVANDLFNKYLDNIEAFLGNRKIVNPITEEEEKPDERLMSEIEKLAGVSESGKREFRHQISSKVAALLRQAQRDGKPLALTFESDETLRKAIRTKLFGDLNDSLRVVLKPNRNEDEVKRYNALIETLCQEHGYTPDSAEELLRFVHGTASF